MAIHWIADFHNQTDWQATNKSSCNIALTEHVIIYTGTFGVILGIIGGTSWMLGFTMFTLAQWFVFLYYTFCTHWVTDYYTSRYNKRCWDEKRVHDFFVGVGFDQFIHLATLTLTWWALVLQ